MKRILVLSLALVFGFVTAGLTAHYSSAATWLIPDDYKTIQSGINSAHDGDIIIVRPGIYIENINFLSKVITVKSTDPNDREVVAKTIIDGGKKGSVVTFDNAEGYDSVLSGITVQNGEGDPPVEGGGICCNSSSPSILKCMITKNSALAGGGIYCNYSSPTIIDCLITENSATGNIDEATGGGGICCYNSAPIIIDCTITRNAASFGGGINCFGPMCHRPNINNCLISQNSASHDGGGIYIQCDVLDINNSAITENSADYGGGICGTWPINGFATDWSIANCLIAQNSARFGAGISCLGYSSLPLLPEYNFPSPRITNCTITGNSASLYGGGILNKLSSPIVTNCILWEDFPNEVAADSLFYRITTHNVKRGSRGNINQIVYSSPQITYSDIRGGYRGAGNINQPPLFVDPSKGDYRLQYNSPCIDTGTDPNISEAEKDSHDKKQPVDGDGDGVANYDMGAYEYTGHLPPVLWVSLDIYPGKELKTLDLRSRKVYIAIIGDKEFDVTTIEPRTIRLTTEGSKYKIAPLHWSYADVSPPHGYKDLLLTFNNQRLVRTLNIRKVEEETIHFTLIGNLKDGSTIKGHGDVYKPMGRSLGRGFPPLWPLID